jgi:transcriptional regulator with XRE-family HTH domain
MTIANRLRTLMRWRGIRSQNQLARISGVPQSTIHRILTHGDTYAPVRGTLVKLASALDTTVPWLTDGVEIVRPPPAPQLRDAAAQMAEAADARQTQVTELQMLFERLSATERRKVIAVVRLIAERSNGDAAAADQP